MSDTTMEFGVGLRPVGRASLRDQVCAQIRNGVLAGQFAPGERITIRALADTLGTSPTPVREALNQFVAEGVFEALPNGSVCVPALTAERLNGLFDIRQVVEGFAAERAASGITSQQCEALGGTLDSLTGLAAKRDFRAYLDVHRRFHFDIYEAAGLPDLTSTIDGLWMRCGPVLNFVVPEYVARKRGAAHHADLVAALRERDGDAARAAVQADIREAGSYLVSLADADGVVTRAPDARRTA